MWRLETRNLGQCVWKPMAVCLPAFVECVRVARQRRKGARAKCWIIEELEGGRQNRLKEGQGGKKTCFKRISQGIFLIRKIPNSSNTNPHKIR